MKILYYVLWPKNEGKDQILKGKANRLINDLISKLKIMMIVLKNFLMNLMTKLSKLYYLKY